MNKRVIILVGPSGCGKSTFIQNYEKEGDYEICSADHYFLDAAGAYRFDGSKLGFAHKASQDKFKTALICGIPTVFVDNTNTRKWEREEYVEVAKARGYEVWLKVFDVDAKTCAARNTHGVPLEAVEKMIARIDVPTGFYQV